MKVVIHPHLGVFDFGSCKTHEHVKKWCKEHKNNYTRLRNAGDSIKERSNPALVQCVEYLIRNKIETPLVVLEIPDDAKNPYIIDYDGYEIVHEGRMWEWDDEEYER